MCSIDPPIELAIATSTQPSPVDGVPPDGPEFPSPNLGSEFDYRTKDGYSFFLKHGPSVKSIAALIHNPFFDENARHNTYDDYWQARDISQHLLGIRCRC